MITDAQLISWLKDASAIRCILVEVSVKTGGVETTRYLSNRGYITKAGDVPANTAYSAVMVGGIKFMERLSLDGSTTSLSFGDIEIENTEGDKDSWLHDVWTNRTIKVFIGDVRWVRADFYQIFDGVVVGIDSKNRKRINIKVSDKIQRLNNTVSEVKLNGTTQNKDKLVPLCFGEVHNISPLLVDPAVNEYQVHNGAIESIIEVRDNGIPVAFTPDLSTGKFRLAAQPAGQITCSVQGAKPAVEGYMNTVSDIIKYLVVNYGHPVKKFAASDLDLTSFSNFKTENPQPVGIYLADRANVLTTCNNLAASVGGRLAMSRNGLLYLVKLALPRGDTGNTVTASDITEKSLTVAGLPDVVAGVKIGYCKNWTVQRTTSEGIPADHAQLHADEWLTVTASDSLAASDYRLHTEPVMQETMLLTSADALAEANRRLNIFNVQRKVVKYVGLPHLMLEKLGSSQTVKHERFGLGNGVTGQIVSLATDWVNPHITVEILI